MSNSEARLVTVVIVCLLAAILGKVWQIERAVREQASASCVR